jgi:hypothetical protein
VIYFIACPAAGAVKIGMCRDNPFYLYTRLCDLQCANPHRLELVGAQDGGIAEEKALHARFASGRIRGEWFKLTPDVSEHIATLTIPEKPFATRKATTRVQSLPAPLVASNDCLLLAT